MKKTIITLLSASLLAGVITLTGCSTTPTATDRWLAEVQTNFVPILVLKTNIVTVLETNLITQTVTRTNDIGIPLPMFITNSTTFVIYRTNVVMETNLVPQYRLTPSTNAT